MVWETGGRGGRPRECRRGSTEAETRETGNNRFARVSHIDGSKFIATVARPTSTRPHDSSAPGRTCSPQHGSCVRTSSFPPVGARVVAACGCLALALLWGPPGALLKSKPMTGLLKPCGAPFPWAPARPEQPYTRLSAGLSMPMLCAILFLPCFP